MGPGLGHLNTLLASSQRGHYVEPGKADIGSIQDTINNLNANLISSRRSSRFLWRYRPRDMMLWRGSPQND
jgi:hypothetical protein